MQSYSRTFASVVGTLTMVVLTIVLAAWSAPQPGSEAPDVTMETRITR